MANSRIELLVKPRGVSRTSVGENAIETLATRAYVEEILKSCKCELHHTGGPWEVLLREREHAAGVHSAPDVKRQGSRVLAGTRLAARGRDRGSLNRDQPRVDNYESIPLTPPVYCLS